MAFHDAVDDGCALADLLTLCKVQSYFLFALNDVLHIVV